MITVVRLRLVGWYWSLETQAWNSYCQPDNRQSLFTANVATFIIAAALHPRFLRIGNTSFKLYYIVDYIIYMTILRINNDNKWLVYYSSKDLKIFKFNLWCCCGEWTRTIMLTNHKEGRQREGNVFNTFLRFVSWIILPKKCIYLIHKRSFSINHNM